MTEAVFKLYADNPSVTEYQELDGRGHSLTIDAGWRDVAAITLEWIASRNRPWSNEHHMSNLSHVRRRRPLRRGASCAGGGADRHVVLHRNLTRRGNGVANERCYAEQ